MITRQVSFFSKIVFMLVLLSLLPLPVSAEDNLLSQAQSLSINLPMKGNSPLGTVSSMQDMFTWLMDVSSQLLKFFTDIMSLFGIQNDPSVTNMKTTLEQGMKQANQSWVNK